MEALRSIDQSKTCKMIESENHPIFPLNPILARDDAFLKCHEANLLDGVRSVDLITYAHFVKIAGEIK